MGTGGVKKPTSNKDDDSRKLRAIETLLREGSRHSEWAEAGLLGAVEKVLDGHGTSSKELKQLMEEASNN